MSTSLIQKANSKEKTVELPSYREIETHSPIGKKLGGIVEIDLKVRVPKNMLLAIQKGIELGYMSDSVAHQLNYQLLVGMSCEFDGYECFVEDFARLVSDPCGLNCDHDLQWGNGIESIIQNRRVRD